MDYSSQPWRFKIKKLMRYCQLYGPWRTLAKVRSHQHMRKKYEVIPPPKSKPRRSAHVGIVGCGKFGFAVVAYFLKHNFGHVLHAAMDRNPERAASLFERYGLNYHTTDASQLLSDPQIDLVFITSNHSSHAEYAIEALNHGKSVHIEKPHAVDYDQLVRLCRAMQKSPGRVSLGFNRPHSFLGREVRRQLDTQSGPITMNWFVAAHALGDSHWYLKQSEGGRILGNFCHWSDFVYQMLPPESRWPIVIQPSPAPCGESSLAVTYTFGDGTVASITFSEKAEPFEGVREFFSAHRGDMLLRLDDFQHLVIDVADQRRHFDLPHRDPGHEANIVRSYRMVRPLEETPISCSIAEVWETADLYLKTKLAVEQNSRVTVHPFDPDVLNSAPVRRLPNVA